MSNLDSDDQLFILSYHSPKHSRIKSRAIGAPEFSPGFGRPKMSPNIPQPVVGSKITAPPTPHIQSQQFMDLHTHNSAKGGRGPT